MDLTQSTPQSPGMPPVSSMPPGGGWGLSGGPTPDAPFPHIEGYKILERIGSGGMGVVYRAVQTKLNRFVALKVLPSVIATPQAVIRFRREASAAARLHHTHIVPIHDYGESPEGYYYSMELIVGSPLNQLIKVFAEENISSASPARMANVLSRIGTHGRVVESETPPAESPVTDSSGVGGTSTSTRGRAYFSQVASWIADAADALHYAHAQRIIHRDIKPANLILSNDGRIMITDFGLARSGDGESITITGAFMGSIRYVSPEQAMAKRLRVDHRTDIYSLGATLYELLTLQPAFPGEDEKEVLALIMTKDPVAPRKLVSGLPAELETICLKALEKAPDQRYDTARAMAEDLRRFLNDLPIEAKRPGPVRRVIKFARRHRAMVTAVTALVLVSFASVITVLAIRKSRESTLQHLFSEAERHREAHEWSDAVTTYYQVLNSDSDHLMSLIHLAIVRKEQYNAALPRTNPDFLYEGIKLCERAIALDPHQDRAWNTKGVLLKMSGRFDEAVEAYKRVGLLKPNDPYVWANLAQVNVLQKDLVQALDNLQKAASAVNPREKYSCNILRDLAVVEFLRGDSTAQSSIARASKCDASERTLVVQSRILLLSPKPDHEAARDAAGAAERTVQEKEVHQYIARYLALANLRLNRFDKAAEYADQAIAMGDMATYNKLILALAEQHLGRAEKARMAYEEAKAAWPATLKNPGEYDPSAVKGFLWFESADELLKLRDEIEGLLPNES